jgi:hypothetical protein
MKKYAVKEEVDACLAVVTGTLFRHFVREKIHVVLFQAQNDPFERPM